MRSPGHLRFPWCCCAVLAFFPILPGFASSTPVAAAAMLGTGAEWTVVRLDANLGESSSGTLDGEDTGRDADGNVGGDREVELLEDLQHL